MYVYKNPSDQLDSYMGGYYVSGSVSRSGGTDASVVSSNEPKQSSIGFVWYPPGAPVWTIAPVLPSAAKNNGVPPCPNGCVSNPINTATGNKLQVETDFVGAANTGLKVVRAYNSQDTWSSAFGANWRSTWHRAVVYTAACGTTPATAKVIREDGRVDTFTLNGSTWTTDPDVTSQLTAVMNTQKQQTGWLLTRDDDSKELYTLDGRLASTTTRAGLVTALSYDAGNRLTKVTGPFGHTLSFAYDTSNRISRITLPDGKTLGYGYDVNNNLAAVTYPDGTVRKYLYENTTFFHALTGIIDEDANRFATYAYDDLGRAVSTEHAGGAELTTVTYNVDGSAGVTDANNNTHSYDFTTQFNLVKPTAMDQTSCAGGSASYTYDANGFLASLTDFDGNVTAYTHNARGLELSRTEALHTPQARTITTVWHPTYHLPTTITEPNRVTTFGYDAKGNLLNKTIAAGALKRTWTYTYNAQGQPLTINGPRTDVNDVTTFSYDAKGDLATITDALGHVTKIASHDADGRPLTVQDPNGLVTTLGYDARGRLTSRTAGT
jgi:YD repeat-containing protein